MTIFVVVGVGVGSLIRNQTAVVVVALIWLLVVDNLLVSFAYDIGKWTPLGATAALAALPIMDCHRCGQARLSSSPTDWRSRSAAPDSP